MPTNITLKNLPDDIYERLKQSAEAHRRSLNSEAIVCLEAVLNPARAPASTWLARAQSLRGMLAGTGFHARDIDRFKRQGRP